MKTYPHQEGDLIIYLVRKDENDAIVAELLQRFEERTQSNLAASARDVQTIQRQAVELSKWQTMAESLATAIKDMAEVGREYYDMDMGPNGAEALNQADVALAAYESAKSGNLPDPLAEAVKRMEEVGIDELSEDLWEHAPKGVTYVAQAVRSRLIQAAKGEQP